ncbi:NAD(P)/FAD-dependent oxidoreductase [Sneathiella sp.]|uniref:NAD(P)/FAD-dependent oxidoreductase n=1 Tax=Sneathiella sp. TaxID=1964365 RepID=UPI00356A1D79
MSSAPKQEFDVIIIGAGAAGMMCALEAGKRGRQVLLLEKAKKTGQKILISGGGRCNFTNIFARPESFLSNNPHFCKSALTRYTQTDFISLVEKQGIAYHEKKLGQLFCDGSAAAIVDLLEAECAEANVSIWRDAGAKAIRQCDDCFAVSVNDRSISASSVVIATGGLSIPKLGANDFAYRIAKTFGLQLVTPKPGLVPLTFDPKDKMRFSELTGISADVMIHCRKTSFRENLLFTHRGLSGPAILQISSFWQTGEPIYIDFLPDVNCETLLKDKRRDQPKSNVAKILGEHLASRLVVKLLAEFPSLPELGNCSDKLIQKLAAAINRVKLLPNGTEGFAKAEVTVGGVSTDELNSKTMEIKSVPGLYFIGEAVDVTGFLGGYNFQWAWSSGYVAGQYA